MVGSTFGPGLAPHHMGSPLVAILVLYSLSNSELITGNDDRCIVGDQHRPLTIPRHHDYPP